MNKHSALSDEQWNRLLNSIAKKQSPPPALHAHITDPSYADFSIKNLNHTTNDNLSHSVNYAKANLTPFAAPRRPEVRDIDDSLLDYTEYKDDGRWWCGDNEPLEVAAITVALEIQ